METPPQLKNNQRQEIGPFAAIIIVISLLLIGAIYFFITQELRIHQISQEQVNS